MELPYIALFRRKDALMAIEKKEPRNDEPSDETMGNTIEHEVVPDLLEEKRESERVSRLIAFGEDW